jgi:trans-aconitate methyltransferase
MSDNDKHVSQYATSATLSTRRGLYDTNVGVSLTDRLDELLQLTTASSLLDVGCGYGADIATFAARYPHLKIVGFDQSEAQVNDAQKKTPGARVFVGDATTFELDQTFDRVLVRHVLHLVPDPAATLERILKHCNEHARAVIAIHSSRSQPKFTAWRSWFKDQPGIGYTAPSDKLTLEGHKDLFRVDGWKTEFIEAAEMIHLTDPEPYLAYIKGQKRWSREPSADELQMLLDYVRRNIENEVKHQGYFEDPSINGVIILER